MSNKKQQLQVKKQLVALLLADSFDVFFRPLSLELPRTLFNLANIPLIEYTLEFLATNGVSIIYVYCCAHADQVQEYLNNSKWRSSNEVELVVITSKNPDMTAGDAMREMYSKGVFRDDFVLVFGDVVANIDIKPIISAHVERRKKDKECIITPVFKEAPVGHRTRSLHDDVMLAIDSSTKQLLAYENLFSVRSIKIDANGLGPWGHKSVQCRYDLIDCGIAICSPDVLHQFQENFDYLNIPQFIQGIVSEEILGAKAHAHIIQGQYAARVNCFRSYRAISYDIINRWTYPMVPDNNILSNTSYRLSVHCVYKEKNVSLSQSCVIEEKTIIGENTVVGPNTIIGCSTIGRNCVIGQNVIIRGSFIWDNVKIDDGVIINDSLIADGVKIMPGANVGRGSIIGRDVYLGKCNLEPFTKLTSLKTSHLQTINLGEHGHGKSWVKPSKKHQGGDLERMNKLVDNATELVPNDPKQPEYFVEFDDSDSDDGKEVVKTAEIYESLRERFLRETRETIGRGETDVVDENAEIELRSLKLAFNVSFAEMVEAMLIAIIENVSVSEPNTLKKVISKWAPYIEKMIETKGETIEIIYQLEDYVVKNTKFISIFPTLLSELYENSIIDAEDIVTWSTEKDEDEDEEDEESNKTIQLLIKNCQPLVKLLQQAKQKPKQQAPVITPKVVVKDDLETQKKKAESWASFADSDYEDAKDEKVSEEEKESSDEENEDEDEFSDDDW